MTRNKAIAAIILINLVGFLLALGFGYITRAGAQPVTPPVGTAALVCAFNTVIPAPASGAFAYVQCDNTGKLITTSSGGGGGTPGGSSGQVQFNSAGTFGGFTVSGDCTLVTSTGVITCTSLNGKAVSLAAALTTTGGATTLAFGAGANTYTFPNSSDTVVTLAATQSLTNKSIAGSEVNSGTVPLLQMPPGLFYPPYITGASMFYGNPYATGATVTSIVGVANSYYCSPFLITQTVTIKALGIQVTTLSAGNTNQALQGAIYNDMITTGNVHRPGTFIDFAGTGSTTGFNTTTATNVSTTMNNGTDTITGPAMIWTCVQKFDATAQFGSLAGNASPQISAALGSATVGRVVSLSNQNSGFSTTGTAFGGANWVNFTSSTTWTEGAGTAVGPAMAIQVN